MNKFGHILVVDDDDGIRNLVKQLLIQENYIVTTSDCAEDANNKISNIKAATNPLLNSIVRRPKLAR